MDFSHVCETDNGIIIHELKRFTLGDILDNGQCFRWNKENENTYSGVAFGKKVELVQSGDQLLITNTSQDDFEKIWKGYFDFERSYDQIADFFSTDESLKKAVDFAPGLRVLRQDPWEALISFILSQNNNIKRIKGLVSRFCENFGEPIDGGFAFPTIEQAAKLTVDDLAPVRAGFRGKYIVDAAQKVKSGEVSLKLPYTLPIDDARKHLMQIKGVGPKVADCVLLFGFNRIESLPVDVWVKRALEKYYPDGFPEKFSDLAGLAQQYLFHYTRLQEDKAALPTA